MTYLWKKIRNSKTIKGVRSFIPHKLVNKAFHFPKSVIANLIYGFPSKKLKVIGITGTKGKTTTAHLIFHILKSQNKKAVLISTILAKFGEKEISTGLHVTNPGPFTLQKLLKKALEEKFEFVILEVTSHGLEQYRNWGIKFYLGVYTQIMSDHLGYHGGIEKYRKAKATLLFNSEKVILNQSDPAFDFLNTLAERRKTPVIIYKGKANDFESQNLSAAISIAQELEISVEKSKKALKSFPGVSGRMEVVQEKPFTIIIDFAHTPGSLESALTKLRSKVKKGGKLIAVFGCAGERDPGRRKMGSIAAKLSDIFIITAEDPRFERIDNINQEIADYAIQSGAKELSKKQITSEIIKNKKQKTIFTKLNDRQEAISLAIRLAKAGDVVGLFGKGHEKSLCFGSIEHPWSEHLAVKKALVIKNKKRWT